MFSGIVEATGQVLTCEQRPGSARITVEKPNSFNDINVGDSVCVDGVCLTIEEFTKLHMQFTLAAETLQITKWSKVTPLKTTVNLERSLRFGDRVHGHLVTGHVDGFATVVKTEPDGESINLGVRLDNGAEASVWKKGSMAINGVSLTVNSVAGAVISFCLIPETLRRTNLAKLQTGDPVNFEVDSMAKAVLQHLENAEKR